MAKVTLWGYVVACDPGCNNMESYHGSIDTADIQPDQDLTNIIENPWWRSSINYRFSKLTFVELREADALFRYGESEVVVPFGAEKAKQLEQVGLSYAYAELYVQVEP